MFIFARCLRSSAAVTPAKYELDIIKVTTVLIIRKKWENNGTEKIGLVTPTPGVYLMGEVNQKSRKADRSSSTQHQTVRGTDNLQ